MKFFPDADFKSKLLQLLAQNVLEAKAINRFYDYCESQSPGDRTIFVQPKNKISKQQSIPVKARLCGIDLPAWMEGAAVKKRVMIISQDPLRDEKAFSHPGIQADPEKDCVLSTPWAAHLKFELPQGAKPNPTINKIRRLAEALTEEDVSIYLTDIYKSFFITPDNKRSITSWTQEDSERHCEILKEEITLVNPDLIVVFGKKALGALEKLFGKGKPEGYIYTFKDLDKPVLHLLHPADWGRQKRFFEHFSGCHGKADNHETAILNVLQAKGYTG